MPQNKQNEEPQYFIDQVLDYTFHRGQIYYLVSWKGFPLSQATWELVDNIPELDQYLKYYQENVKNFGKQFYHDPTDVPLTFEAFMGFKPKPAKKTNTKKKANNSNSDQFQDQLQKSKPKILKPKPIRPQKVSKPPTPSEDSPKSNKPIVLKSFTPRMIIPECVRSQVKQKPIIDKLTVKQEEEEEKNQKLAAILNAQIQKCYQQQKVVEQSQCNEYEKLQHDNVNQENKEITKSRQDPEQKAVGQQNRKIMRKEITKNKRKNKKDQIAQQQLFEDTQVNDIEISLGEGADDIEL